MMISAVLDACVLYSAPLRDFMLRLAFNGLVDPFWSEEIHDEWTRSLLRKRAILREKLERTCREMDSHFPNACVHGHEGLIPTLQLPDPNDRHVLAVAIHAKVKYIVTFNLTDFPKLALLSYQVEAITPDDFVLRVIASNADVFVETVARHRAGLVNPSLSASEYLATLEKQGLPKTVMFLRKHASDI
jgi:predicted nucleic acid-binding protein